MDLELINGISKDGNVIVVDDIVAKWHDSLTWDYILGFTKYYAETFRK